jgi:hypothetical protein
VSWPERSATGLAGSIGLNMSLTEGLTALSWDVEELCDGTSVSLAMIFMQAEW